MTGNRTLVVIPAYNEEATIKEVVTRSMHFADVCVIDDCSKDNTRQIVKQIPGVICIEHQKNTHIPKALLDGMRYGVEEDYDYIITMDAGLSHLPEELPRFIKAPSCDLVVGYRKARINVPFYRRVLSFIATKLMNFALKPAFSKLPSARFRDVTSGYRRYSHAAAELLLQHRLKARSFDFHTESFMLIYRNGMSIREVPVTYNFSNSSLNSKIVRDGVLMFLDILFSRRK